MSGVDLRAKTPENRPENFDFYPLFTPLFRTGPPTATKVSPKVFRAPAALHGAAGPGYLKAVWLEIFGPVFPGFSAEIDPRDPPRSPGPASHINFHEKSAPQTNSKTKKL